MNDIMGNTYFVKGVHSIALILVVIVLARITISFVRKHRRPNSEAPHVIKYVALGFFTLGLIVIWLEDLAPILTALTIVAAALTIVSKEILLNFLGSFVIFWRELFTIGDRVQIGDHTGDVIDKGLLYFTLLEVGRSYSKGHSTGRLVKIPNSFVHIMPVINATRGAGYVWNELSMVITVTSDREKARTILCECADEYLKEKSINFSKVKEDFASKKVFFKELHPIVYVSAATGGVRLTLRYLCRSRMSRESEDFISTRFLDRLEPGVVDLAKEQE